MEAAAEELLNRNCPVRAVPNPRRKVFPLFDPILGANISSIRVLFDVDALFVRANVVKDMLLLTIPGFAANARLNVPEVVTVVIPVLVNKLVRDGSTVSETEMTEPVPAEGETHVSEDPVEERYWPDVPIVARPRSVSDTKLPVPPEAVPSGVDIVKDGDVIVILDPVSRIELMFPGPATNKGPISFLIVAAFGPPSSAFVVLFIKRLRPLAASFSKRIIEYEVALPLVLRILCPISVAEVAIIENGQFNVAAVVTIFGKTKLTAPISIWYLLIYILAHILIRC